MKPTTLETAHAVQQVLLIECDPDYSRRIQLLFRRTIADDLYLRSVGQLSSGIEVLARDRVDLVLLELNLPDSKGLETLAAIRAAAPSAAIIVLTFEKDEARLLEAVGPGAVDFFRKSRLEAPLLMQSIHAAIKRQRALGCPLPPEKTVKPGKVIGILGAKGGVGATTVTLNLAAALAGAGRTVIAGEVRPDRGAFRLFNRQPNPEHAGSLLRTGATVDRQSVAKKLCTIGSGLKLLYAPAQDHSGVASVDPERAGAVIQELSFQAEYTLLDLPSYLPPDCVASVRLCDYIVLVIEPDPICVTAAKQMLDSLEELGAGRALTGVVVVKRVATDHPLNMESIRASLGCTLIGMVPLSPIECRESQEMGRPLVVTHPDSLAAFSLSNLAARLAADPLATILSL